MESVWFCGGRGVFGRWSVWLGVGVGEVWIRELGKLFSICLWRVSVFLWREGG